jgi:hypothetical protein
MRIYFANLSRPKAVAKSMQNALGAFIDDIKLSACQQLTSQLFGYQSWHELTKSIGLALESADDDMVGAEAAASRKEYQIQRLVAAGIAPSISRYLIETLHPTARRAPDLTSKLDFCQHISLLAHAFSAVKFSLQCVGPAVGSLSYWVPGEDGFVVVDDPIKRSSLATSAMRLFGEGDIKSHHADRITVSGRHWYGAWRTQWYGKHFYPDFTGLKADVAFSLVGVGLIDRDKSGGADGATVRNPVINGINVDKGQRTEGEWLSVQEAQQHMALVGTRSWYGQ